MEYKEEWTMGENGLSASDVALMSRDGDGFGNGWGGMIWLFAILAMMGGGFNGWNRGYQPQYATQDFVQNGFNFNDLQDQNRDIMQAINYGASQSIATTNQVYHDLMNGLSDKYNELQRDIAGLAVGQANQLARINECCCTTQAAIAQANYDAAMRDAATNANFTSQIQGLKDMIKDDKMNAMQNRINQLELQNQLQGVVRYPNGWTYNAGTSPFCGGCGNM
jgi:hypothetical protein